MRSASNLPIPRIILTSFHFNDQTVLLLRVSFTGSNGTTVL